MISNENIPSYIADRLRAEVPKHSYIVPGSTPVVAFGNCLSARVATLGLNPSRQEFLAKDGKELSDDKRRFETLRSLGVSGLDNAPDSVLESIFRGCCDYFARNPYRRWFDPLEKILTPLGASYYDGTACHLDFVQWATDPVWSKFTDKNVLDRLLNADAPFLAQQLRQQHLRILLLNGSSVINMLRARLGVQLEETCRLAMPVRAPAKILVGRLWSCPELVYTKLS